MTPQEAYETQLHGHHMCDLIIEMFQKQSYDSSYYDHASEDLDKALHSLVEGRFFHYHAKLASRANNLIDSHHYARRAPSITQQDLIKHLKRYSVHPGIVHEFISSTDDADLQKIAIDSALRYAHFDVPYSLHWGLMLKELASAGDVSTWMYLSSALFHGSGSKAQRLNAITTVGGFDDAVLAEQRGLLSMHLTSLIEGSFMPIDLVAGLRTDPGCMHPGLHGHRVLKDLGLLGICHQIFNADIFDYDGIFQLQDKMKEFGWQPDSKALDKMSVLKATNAKELAMSAAVHFLQMRSLPEKFARYGWDLEHVADVLNLDGQRYPLGTIRFNRSLVGQMIDRALDAAKIERPYDRLRKLGVSEELAMTSIKVSQARLGSDLGL